MKYAIPLLALLSTPALAQEQPKCAPFDQVQAMLAQEFQETVVAQAIMGEGEAMLVLFASKEGQRTWTAVVVKHDGVGCFASGGTDWQERNDPAPVPETGL